jgi:transcriptional regulator with XRE-family HTH domain
MLTLADQLRQAIRRSGKTRYRIARESGVAEAVLSRFVRGERDMKLDTANKLSEALGLRVELKPKGKRGAKSRGKGR